MFKVIMSVIVILMALGLLLMCLTQLCICLYRLFFGLTTAKDYCDEAKVLSKSIIMYQEKLNEMSRGDEERQKTLTNLMQPSTDAYYRLMKYEVAMRRHNYNSIRNLFPLIRSVRKARKCVSELEFISTVWDSKV